MGTTRSRTMVGLVFLTFFIMSLLTNILGAVVPDIISGFHVNLAAAALLPFSFFIAYGVMSVPAGFMVERFLYKRVMIFAFLIGTAGSLIFAIHPAYRFAAASLFLMGSGMAILQTAINPLLRVSGGEEYFAFNSAMAQLIFGLASFASPLMYSYLVVNLGTPPPRPNPLLAVLAAITPRELPWTSMYWIFAAVTLLMIALLVFVRFPRVQPHADEAAGTLSMYVSLLRKPLVWFYFISVFAYVGCEQGTADWISRFLAQYCGIDPHTAGATAVSRFWLLLTVGCFVGLILLKLFDSRRVLACTAIGALLCLTAGLFGPPQLSVLALPGIGLFASVMWPILVSLALNSVEEHHGAFGGILSTGIMGGAVVPVIIGSLGDRFGLRVGMCFLYVTFGVVLSVSFWAKPLVNNATIIRKKETSAQV